MKKPRVVESVEDFYALLRQGPVSGVLLLSGPLRSSHEFRMEGQRIVDDSMVDGSRTRFSKAQFEGGFYAQAIRQGRFWVE